MVIPVEKTPLPKVEAQQRLGELEGIDRLVYRTPTKHLKELPVSGSDFLDMCESIGSGEPLKRVISKYGMSTYQWACLEQMEPMKSIIATAQKAAALAIESDLMEDAQDVFGVKFQDEMGAIPKTMIDWQKHRHGTMEKRLKSLDPTKYNEKMVTNVAVINNSIHPMEHENMTIEQILALPIGDMKKASEL